MNSAIARATWCLLALGLYAAAAGCAGTSRNDTVTILVPWDQGTSEYNAFLTVVKPFGQQNRVQVILEPSRAPIQQLEADQAASDLPDLADLPSPGSAYQLQGLLKPLHIDLRSYDQPWLGLAELGTGTVYAVPVKADIKGLIWYNKGVLKTPPTSWKALENISRHGHPWCLGLASGAASGWPGTDWVAEILLSKYQAAAYQNWLSGKLPWTAVKVRTAWTTWGTLMRHGAAINGGVVGALTTTFSDAGSKMAFGRCELEHGALAATGLNPTARYDYVPFPSTSAASPIQVSGDFMGLFTNNPNARKLLSYLASRKAQTLWVKQAGYAFSADRQVVPAAYPAGVQRKIARLFQPERRTLLCFSADDMMRPDVSAAFQQAVLYYINDPAQLDSVLAGLQLTQQGARPSPLANRACAKP